MLLLVGHRKKVDGFENFQAKYVRLLLTNDRGLSLYSANRYIILTIHESYDSQVLACFPGLKEKDQIPFKLQQYMWTNSNNTLGEKKTELNVKEWRSSKRLRENSILLFNPSRYISVRG